MWLLLNIISSILKWAFAPFLFLYGSVRSVFTKNFDQYNKSISISKDQYGNAVGQYFFNDLFVKTGGECFGNPDETISSVVGKNFKSGTLSKLGNYFKSFLDFFENDHSIKAIESDETDEIKL